MGYTKYTGSDEAQYQYIVDTDSDIENLPTSAKGSMAMSIESGNFYALNSNNEWTSVGAGSSGGGGSVLLVEMTRDENWLYSLDKTWKEIKDAFFSGVVIVHFDDENEYEHYEYWYQILKVQIMHDAEIPRYFVTVSDTYTFATSTETGYPSYDAN